MKALKKIKAGGGEPRYCLGFHLFLRLNSFCVYPPLPHTFRRRDDAHHHFSEEFRSEYPASASPDRPGFSSSVSAAASLARGSALLRG